MLGEAPRANAQFYHGVSLRVQQMGFGSRSFSYSTLTPGYVIANNSFQIIAALEIPVQKLVSQGKWVGEELRPSETAEIKRWVGKLRLKSQPQSGKLGFIYAAANYYSLEVGYRNTAVFGETASKSNLKIATYGAGLFEFWEMQGQVVHLLGAELLLCSDFKTVDLSFELKALVLRDVKLGLVLEALQPKPRFTSLYAGVYAEYTLRW